MRDSRPLFTKKGRERLESINYILRESEES
jgi:hypothetical protein